MNKKIPTIVGAIIIIIIAITVAMLVWKWEENKRKTSATNRIAPENSKQETVSGGEEFPTVPIQPGMSMEDIIKQAIYKKSPEWKAKNYSIEVTVETNKENHAIGKLTYDGYNITKDGSKHHNAGEQIWFAAEATGAWTLVQAAGSGYWGSCQSFKKYNFPTDMTPDCWDTEKNILIDTSNPKRFYPSGFTKTDKGELKQAFISFMKREKESGKFVPDSYLQKDLYVKIDKKVNNYVRGTTLVGGRENISTPYFLAVKKNSRWIVVHNGQDIPLCSAIELYKFPKEIVGTCYDEINKKEKTIL